MANSKKQQREFVEIFSDYFPLLCNIIYTKVGNKEDAKDIAQETMALCFEKMDEIENLRSWIFGTSKNMIKRYYENKKKKYETDVDDIALTFVNGFRDTRLIIEKAIENVELDEEEKSILEYIAYNNCSYAEVGRIMGFSKWQVGRKYVKIVKKFDDYFKNIGINNIEDLL